MCGLAWRTPPPSATRRGGRMSTPHPPPPPNSQLGGSQRGVYVRALKVPLLTARGGTLRAKEGGGRMHAGDARMGRLNPSARPSATRIYHPYLSVCPSLRPPDRPLSLGASVRPPDRPLSLGVSLLASAQSTPIFWCAPPCPPHRPLSLGPIAPYVSECPSLRPPHCPLSLGVSLLASTQSSPISRCVPTGVWGR